MESSLVAIEALKVLSCDGEGAVFSDFKCRISDGFRSCVINKGFDKLVLSWHPHRKLALHTGHQRFRGHWLFSCYSIRRTVRPGESEYTR